MPVSFSPTMALQQSRLAQVPVSLIVWALVRRPGCSPSLLLPPPNLRETVVSLPMFILLGCFYLFLLKQLKTGRCRRSTPGDPVPPSCSFPCWSHHVRPVTPRKWTRVQSTDPNWILPVLHALCVCSCLCKCVCRFV